MIKPIITVGLISFTGAWAFAQAPVVDLNDPEETTETRTTTPSIAQATRPVTIANPTDVETRLMILERKDKSRVEAQQRVQQQLDTLQSEVDELRGSIELHNHQLEQILQRQRDLYLELDKRFANIDAQPVGNSGVAAGVNTQSSGSASQTNTSIGQSEEQAYQSAVNLILKERDYDAAVPAFQRFLASYPNSSYTDNAHYWLGQLLFNQQNWSEAREQFSAVVNKFANSPKRADAILKLGMVAKAENSLSEARTLFEQVISEYPDSAPSRLATEQLKSL
ncbi:tol-pal system protein YbgF [Glaciecola sp. MH2013]|uniref:tol-pal system protein YbgF n=1 Tax=Glaciecola sp. MH2013 TaxID=2785524 RepID=UPI00189C6879|nr:tol-pal system protein YbgF [Glaciecola sp. MH2013]MBF7073225.1 tol-pal system protein YbgF [Glaciecola sp. MH2013]